MRRVTRLRGLLASIPVPLRILLVVALVHGTAWSIATAPLGGPDEDAHTAYAQYLAETGHTPARDTGSGSQSTAVNVLQTNLNLLPIRGHLEGRPFWSLTDKVNKSVAGLPMNDGSGPNPAGGYPPAYYAYAAAAYRLSPDRSLLGRLWAMRFAGVLLFVAMVFFAWLLAAEIFAATWQRTLVTAVVALQPKLGFMAGVVNPDIMLCAVGTAALWLGVRTAMRGATMRRALGLGVLAGLAALSHPRGLFLPPFAVLAVLVGLWRVRPSVRHAVTVLGACIAPAIVSLVVGVLWTRAHAPGTAFGANSPVTGFNPGEFASYLWQFYLPKLTAMNIKVGPDYGYRQVFIQSFYGTFGWLEINYSLRIYDMLQVASGVLALWVFGLACRRPAQIAAKWPVPAILLTYAFGLLLLLHLVSYSALRGTVAPAGDPVITGRYLLPMTAILGCAIAWVVSALPRWARPFAAGAVVMVFALLAVAGLGLTLERFNA